MGVMALDMEDRIESWNAQMEVMYALPRWQTLTQPLKAIFPAEFVEEFYRVRQNPGIHNLYKFRLMTPAAETRTVNVAIAPLVTRKFQVVGRLIIVDDITERIELEAQLSQADKLSLSVCWRPAWRTKSNTPLAVISSYTQMLAKQLQGDPQKSGLLEKITRQTFRASEIVNNLLNFSRTSGTEFADVDVNKVIADTLALLEHQFKIAKVEVHNQLSSRLPSIQGNPGRLQQVFLNLFLNAKDAMPGGGTLHVATLTARASASAFPTPDRASHPNISSAFTIRSSPPRPRHEKARPAAPALVFPLPTASFRNMRERSAWRAVPATAPPSRWISR